MGINDIIGKRFAPNFFTLSRSPWGASLIEILGPDARSQVKASTEFLPDACEPIAMCESGDLLVQIGAGREEIFYWHHEDPHNLFLVARNLYSLLKSIRWDTEEDDLAPEPEVLSKWIDPDFEPEFDDDEVDASKLSEILGSGCRTVSH